MSPYRSMERRPAKLARRRWFVKARLKKVALIAWMVVLQAAMAYFLHRR